eukprot:TRINITY_DN3194_c0_g1_i4.p2 TRINITY_DN3194_c0_g1~~TRINITY_DN3194_c0_g1_i4.p2  ORF type:complete len:491 (+),score=56.63 TRINITY_DN3194_c0_g1_i4:211-1473(+)
MKPKVTKQTQYSSPEVRSVVVDRKMVSKQSSLKGAKFVQLLDVKSSSLMFDMELESGGAGGRAKSFDVKDPDTQFSSQGGLNFSLLEEQCVGGSGRNSGEGAKGAYFEILVKPQTELEILLYQQVKVFKPHCKSSHGALDLSKLMDLLRKIGYVVNLQETLQKNKQKGDATSVPHKFLICTGHLQRPEGPKAEIVLDPCFRQQFNLANSTNSYQDLLKGVPEIFVGSKHRLAKVVRKLSDEMKVCFRDTGLPLPPWRSPRAMLAKWFTHEEIHDLLKKEADKEQAPKPPDQQHHPHQPANTKPDMFQQIYGVKNAGKFQPIQGFNKVVLGGQKLNADQLNGKDGTVHGKDNYKRLVANCHASEELFRQQFRETNLKLNGNVVRSPNLGNVDANVNLENFIPRDESLLSQAVKQQKQRRQM